MLAHWFNPSSNTSCALLSSTQVKTDIALVFRAVFLAKVMARYTVYKTFRIDAYNLAHRLILKLGSNLLTNMISPLYLYYYTHPHSADTKDQLKDTLIRRVVIRDRMAFFRCHTNPIGNIVVVCWRDDSGGGSPAYQKVQVPVVVPSVPRTVKVAMQWSKRTHRSVSSSIGALLSFSKISGQTPSKISVQMKCQNTTRVSLLIQNLTSQQN